MRIDRMLSVVFSVAAFPGAAAASDRSITFNDNGGWCWFQDERAIVDGDLLVIGSVATQRGAGGDQRAGNIEVTAYDLRANALRGVAVLSERLESDDHDVPAFLVRPDGRLVAVYSRHGTDRLIRSRIAARPGDALDWEPERRIERGAGVTYSNLFRLAAENGGNGRTYDFYRGEGWNPNFVVSDDDGETWTFGGRLVAFDGRPYVKYASNGRDEIHFITTEHHPQNYDNSIYHGFVRGGVVHTSEGSPIRSLAEGPIRPSEATRIFAGDKDRVAWTVDLHLDADGRPYAGYSVQMNGNPGDLRYRYARWDGSRWHDHAMACAGSALYDREKDYSGLIALHPHDPSVVYISADADPATGQPLVSAADGRRHYEIFRGCTPDGGASWQWESITRDSTVDNLRPIVPRWRPGRTILLWLRGTYLTYTDYDLDVVGRIDPEPLAPDTEEDAAKRTATTILKAAPDHIAARPGSGFGITYRWLAVPTKRDCTVFVHFVDESGRTVLQDDHEPPVPTSGWSGAVSYTRTVPLEQWKPEGGRTIDIGLPEGRYDIYAGLYDDEGREALLAGPGVESVGGERCRIGVLTIDANAPIPAPGRKTLDLTGYHLTFDEEFDELSVSAWGPAGPEGTRWIAHTPWRGDFGDARFTDPRPDFPFTVKDGVLRIEARREDGRWRSGLLSAVDPDGNGFRQQHGYFECRAKFPRGPGTWPAFWLMGLKSLRGLAGNTGPRLNPEIDVVEHYGHWPWRFSYAFHLWGFGGLKSTHEEKRIVAFGTEEDFHTYGMMIDEESMVLYFDGVEMLRSRTPEAARTPLFPLVNLALGPGWPTDRTPNPSYMYVDYVRVWKKGKASPR